ncbi:MAG: pilus assembly protein PilP [Gammaproteobacteria bacterium]|nr:pilus assembly protein PilP [Gammaproteobacteria bacterium]
MLRYTIPLLILGLTACSDDANFHDLDQYVADVEARQRPKIKPLPEFTPYETYLYQSAELRNPFIAPELSDVQSNAAGDKSGVAPDPDRSREAMELFPLDSLRMVGTLEQNGVMWALIMAPDDAINRLRVGNYMGQNYGRIIGISEYEIELTEIIPDGMGAWSKSNTTITLAE